MSLTHRLEPLLDAGEYRAALDVLSGEKSLPQNLLAVQVFIESHLGDLRKAQAAAESLLKRHPDPSTSALCRHIVSRSWLVHGERLSDSLRLSSEALEIARSALGLTWHARYAAHHALALLQRVSIGEASAQLPSLRKLVLASGDVQSLVATHLIQAEIRIKQGQLRKAVLDIRTADELLSRHPHLVLRGQRALAAAAVESLDGTATSAQRFAEEALMCADRSGSVSLRIPALVTLAHMLLLVGDFAGCASRLDQALRCARPSGPALIAIYDTQMQLRLATGAMDEAAHTAESIQDISRPLDGGHSYYGLWHLHTRARWLLLAGRAQEALSVMESALPHAERIADRNLLVRVQLAAAEALGACGRPHDGAGLLATVLHQNPDPPLEVVAECSRVSGCLAVDNRAAAAEYFERAVRIYDALGHHSAKTATESQARAVVAHGTEPSVRFPPGSQSSVSRAIESCAALSYVTRHPRLLGSEILLLLQAIGLSSHSALLEETDLSAGPSAGLAETSVPAQDLAVSPYGTRIRLGTANGRRYELRIEACSELLARNTVKAVERLVTVCSAFEAMRQHDRDSTAFVPEQSPEEQLGFVYASQAMADLVRITRQVAPSHVTVLITGETGVGKEVFARALHSASGRAGGPFIPFNCTAVPRDMLDSQLFGYRRGSFTGAVQEYPGLIRAAQGGTLFLDEIGEMPLDVQPKLLRFLESGEILPLGETQPIHVNVRVVAATNADLDALVADGRFREDLFYRLHVVRLRVPPLRDRREEIPLLVRAMVDRLAKECQREPLRFSEEALEYLTIYHWPGNARQLANELHRLMVLTQPGALVTPEDLSPEIGGSRAPVPVASGGTADLVISTHLPLATAVERVERALIVRALERHAGNLERAAAALGLSRKGLFLKRQRLGLDRS